MSRAQVCIVSQLIKIISLLCFYALEHTGIFFPPLPLEFELLKVGSLKFLTHGARIVLKCPTQVLVSSSIFSVFVKGKLLAPVTLL